MPGINVEASFQSRAIEPRRVIQGNIEAPTWEPDRSSLMMAIQAGAGVLLTSGVGFLLIVAFSSARRLFS